MSVFAFASKLFLVLNVFLLFLGVSVITIGAVIITESGSYSPFLYYGFLSVPIWVVVIGVLICLLALYGLCAGYTESTCLLYTYGSFVAILFLAGISLLIYVTVESKEADNRIKEELYDIFEDYDTVTLEEKLRSQENITDEKYLENMELTEAIDNFQQDLRCCGVEEYTDWFNFNLGTIPDSCCKNVSNCNADSLNPSGIFVDGCYDRAVDQLSSKVLALFVISIFLVIVEGLCVVLACGISTAIFRYQYVS